MPMDSPTTRRLSPEEVSAGARAGFGAGEAAPRADSGPRWMAVRTLVRQLEALA